MDIQRLIVFFIFSFSLLLLWDSWQRQQTPPPPATAPDARPLPSAQPRTAPPVAPQPSAQTAAGEKIAVRTDTFYAELSTLGGDLQRLELLGHRDAFNKKNLILFSPVQPNRYLAQTGLIGQGLPTHVDVFRSPSRAYSLTAGQERLEVPLVWQGNGLTITKTYVFHRNSYVIDVWYRIENQGPSAIAPDIYYQLVRDDRPPPGDSSLVPTYTGPAIYTDQEKFKKLNFGDIQKGKITMPTANNGWVAMLQHYFVSAWLPQTGKEREFYAKPLKDGTYAAGVILLQPLGTVAPGEAKQLAVPLYAGPQEQAKLAKLAPGLDLTVDYGWLTVIAAPLFWVLAFIHKGVGNWGVAIILLTVLIKLLFYPLSAKSYHSMAQMRVLAPKLQRIKEQYGNDRQKMQGAMMELYKTEKINPLGGCLPILVQIPVFIALYWVLLASVEMRHAPFALWIKDLSAPDPYYILPIIMGVTMIIQTKLNPTPPDPIQAKVMTIMPIVFSVFFFFFPAGLVLYWVVNNVLSIAQQQAINRSMERKAAAGKGHGQN